MEEDVTCPDAALNNVFSGGKGCINITTIYHLDEEEVRGRSKHHREQHPCSHYCPMYGRSRLLWPPPW